MNAEQYRALVNKLERINEDDDGPTETFPPLKIGDIDPRNGKKILDALTSSDGNVVRSRFGDIWNVKYGDPDPVVAPPTPDPTPDPTPVVAPPTPAPVPDPEPVPDEVACSPELRAKIRLMPSFTQAYAAAKDGTCPDFEWCQIITVPGIAPQRAQGWEAHGGQNTGGGAAVGNPNITAQGRKSGATQVPDVPFQKATGYTPSPEEAQAIIDNGQPNDIQRYGGLDALKKIAGQKTVKEDELTRWRKIAGLLSEDDVAAGPNSNIDDATRQRAMDFVKNADTAPAPADSKTDNSKLPEIKASSKSAAIAQAVKKGLKPGDKFRWCTTYAVKDAVKEPIIAPQKDTDPWYSALGKGSENSKDINKPDPTAAAFGNPNLTRQGRRAGATQGSK